MQLTKFLILLFFQCAVIQIVAQSNTTLTEAENPTLNPNEAFEHLLENVANETCNPCTTQLAELAYKAGRFSEVLKYAENALAADSLNLTALYLFSKAHEKRANYKVAFLYAQKLALHNENSVAYQKRLAYLAIKIEQPSVAISAYLAALALNPNDEEAGYDLALLLYKLNLYKQAEHIATQFIQYHPEHVGFIGVLAKIQFQLKAYDIAIYWANKHISQQDSTTEMGKIVAVSLVKTNKFEASLRWFMFLNKHAAMNENLYFYKATAFENLGASDSALANYKYALSAAQSPNEGQYHLNLALLYDAKKDYKNAIVHYKEAYTLLEKEVILYYLARASETYYQDQSVAVRYYQQYLENSDTTFAQSKEYASQRISELRTAAHLKLDTL